MAGPLVLGLDGFPGGWVCVALEDGSVRDAFVAGTLSVALQRYPAASVVGVDMPVALQASGYRRADAAARDFVRPLASSVFAVPPLPALAATSHAEAVAIARSCGGPAPSAQCWKLFAKIREARDALAAGAPVIEVHPEVSFRAMSGEGPVARKRTWDGLVQRMTLLEREGIVLPRSVGGGSAPPDDVLDAVAVAWSASRYAAGRARSLPPDPTPAERELGAVVWY